MKKWQLQLLQMLKITTTFNDTCVYSLLCVWYDMAKSWLTFEVHVSVFCFIYYHVWRLHLYTYFKNP
jgi:hypothetical protein